MSDEKRLEQPLGETIFTADWTGGVWHANKVIMTIRSQDAEEMATYIESVAAWIRAFRDGAPPGPYIGTAK